MKKILTKIGFVALLVTGSVEAQTGTGLATPPKFQRHRFDGSEVTFNMGIINQEHGVNFSILGQQYMLKGDFARMYGGFMGLSQNLYMFANLSLAPGIYFGYASIDDMLLVPGSSNNPNLSLISLVDSSTVALPDSSATLSNLYAKIPFFLNLRFGWFYLYGGPTFCVGMARVSGLATVENISNVHFDMGATAGLGFKVNSFQVYAGCNFGLGDNSEKTSVQPTGAWSYAWEGKTFFVGLGVRL